VAGAVAAVADDLKLFWLGLAAFASATSMRVCDPMLPRLAQDFDLSLGAAAGVITLYTVAYGLFQLVHGPIGDHHGKPRVVALASLVSAAGSLACALAPGFAVLPAARFVTGASAAAIVPLSMAFIGDSVAYHERQRALAKFINATILGLVLGQAMGGLFADTLGWRAAFALLALLFATAGVALVRTGRSQPAATVSAATVSAATAPAGRAAGPGAGGAVDAAGAMGAMGTSGTSSTVDAAAAVGALARYRAVLAAPWARIVLATVLLEGVLVFGALAFFPSFLHRRFGLALWAAGATVTAFGVGGILYTASVRVLMRRLGERGLSLAGGALLAAGFLLMAAAGSLYLGVLACLLAGLGYYMLHNTLQTNATQMVPAQPGTAVSMFAMSLFLGQSVGVAAAGLAVPAGGFEPTFVFCGIALALLGALFAASFGRRPAAHAGDRP